MIVAKTTVAAERGVQVVLSDDSALGEDPPHLRRLLTIVGNLLDNAIDAAAGGPPPAGRREVELSLVEAVDQVLLRVADSGPGDSAGRRRADLRGRLVDPARPGIARRGLGLVAQQRRRDRSGREHPQRDPTDRSMLLAQRPRRTAGGWPGWSSTNRC
ncbi:ATP-binding protein [Streptomyces azureus]|uniref:Signal transduction histidine kinase regulating citrate/malate metabolism n=1 Tax=Streptomyces azureus TaxID=146537 RepID=A0A0K8PYT3_STRAJ|nr:ATP-binding protein [Streptomyces azureus]GAP52624.1 signal transduction histidine kinase regulating citrate/malate metabolism [Streptomyces azureus]